MYTDSSYLATVLFFFLLLLYPKVSYTYQSRDLAKSDSLLTGTVYFQPEVDTVYVYLDKKYDNLITLVDHDSLSLPVGNHHLFVFGKRFIEAKYYLQIEAGEKEVLKLNPYESFEARVSYAAYRAAYARLKWGANLIIDTDNSTAISIEGEHKGFGSYKGNYPTGSYKLILREANGAEHKRILAVQKHRLRYYKEFFQPAESMAKSLSFIPGASQIYKDQNWKAAGIISATSVSAALLLNYQIKFSQKKNDFYKLWDKYDNTGNEEFVVSLGDQVEAMETTVNNYERRRNILLLFTGLLYAFNIYDAFKEPEYGFYREKGNPFKNFEIQFGEKHARLTFKIKF
ncbi:MAG: DUF5683 domain-containing protein [Bacteroidota bacterium]